jgi:hypothetical protein
MPLLCNCGNQARTPGGLHLILWISVATVLIPPIEIGYPVPMNRQAVIALAGVIWLAATAFIMQYALGPGQTLP